MNTFNYMTLLVKLDDRGVCNIIMNRPEKRNALSAQMIADLTHVAETIGQDPLIRAMILSGNGDFFCAGGDLGWMQSQILAGRAERIQEATKLADMLYALNTMPVPLIGKVHGGAFGGGGGLVCVCDVAIAANGTKFGFTETRLGLIPATIGPYVIARIGEGNARRVFMSARIFDAAEACALDVISKEVDETMLDAAIEAEVAAYLSVAPRAVGSAKALARFLGSPIDRSIIDETIRRLADTWEGEEAKEGIDAFLNKRPAPWAKKPNGI